MQRPSKIFVTLGLQRLSAIPQRAEDNDPRRPLYEARVLPGVNRIEVEMVAGMARGNAKAGPGQEIELEKITVFVNVARKWSLVFDASTIQYVGNDSWESEGDGL